MNFTAVFRAAGLAVLLALSACAPQAAPGQPDLRQLPMEELTVETSHGPVRFHVEMATTEAQREQGLMYRRSMPADHGMLFVFDPPQPVAFWMHNTYLSLDIIFIGQDGRILNIADHATPFSDANIPSEGAARGVLELNAGRAAELGILPGDLVRHGTFTQP